LATNHIPKKKNAKSKKEKELDSSKEERKNYLTGDIKYQGEKEKKDKDTRRHLAYLNPFSGEKDKTREIENSTGGEEMNAEIMEGSNGGEIYYGRSPPEDLGRDIGARESREEVS